MRAASVNINLLSSCAHFKPERRAAVCQRQKRRHAGYKNEDGSLSLGGLRGPVMPTKAVLLVFLAALWSPSLGDLSTAPITTDWIPRVSRKMTTFAESQTGALQLIQEYDDKLSFSQTQIDGQAQLNLLTQAAGDRLKKCREILHRNKAEIEASHAQGPAGGASASDCCDNLGQLEYDPRFLQQIVNDSCATFTAVDGATNTIRPQVYDTMKSNIHENTGVTWQYYGAKEGEYHQFPKNDRNWYVSAASPKKKNVVIVIDVSESMRKENRINLAKQAALTVLDTLTARDWAGVVSFSNDAETPQGCFGDIMAEANPGNIDIMRDFINSLSSDSATYYAKGFKKAFDIFYAAKQNKPSRTVHIFTYGLGNEIQDAYTGWCADPNDSQCTGFSAPAFLADAFPNIHSLKALEFLATIADQNNMQVPGAVAWTNEDCRQNTYFPCLDSNRDPQGVGPSGRNATVGDGEGDKLVTMMGSYYDFFQSEPEPTFSVPTKDEHLGLTITGAIRTTDSNGEFFGVTAVDISMDIVFNEIVNFNLGLYSHAFLVDREDGRVLIHRDLPKPMEWPTDPTFLHLDAMKGVLLDDEVYKILNGESGSCSHNNVKVPVTRGDSQFDGVFTLEKPATFYYEPIPDSKYSVVLCLFDEDRTITVPNQVNPENGTQTVFHQLDLSQSNTDVCRLYGNYATQDGSTVMFPPEAYADPIGYLSSLETAEDVVNIEQFLNDLTGSVDNPGLLDGVRTDVILTSAIEQYWRQNASDSVWRYVGTRNGMFRIFPGIALDRRYDPTQQGWYKRALSRPNDYTFSRPVPSTFGGGNMVTISRVIANSGYVGITQYTETQILGVIAADIIENQYKSLLYSEVPYGPSDSTEHGARSSDEQIPLAGQAISGQWWSSMLFYDTSGFTGHDVTTGDPCTQFSMYPVTNTNTFLLVLHNRQTNNCDDRQTQDCSCDDVCQSCDANLQSVCQCPCSCAWDHESCTDGFLGVLTDIPCPPPREVQSSPAVGQLGGSPPYQPDPSVPECEVPCSAQPDKPTCEALPHCGWCEEMDFPVCKESCAPTTPQSTTAAATTTIETTLETTTEEIMTTAVVTTTDPPQLGPPVDCATLPAGMYPDPQDCTKFYQCTGAPEPAHMPCPAGTLFDWTLSICTFTSFCTISQTTISPTSADPTTLPQTTADPTTLPQTTAAPTTLPPTTAASTTLPPTTAAQTTLPPTTAAQTTLSPTTVDSVTPPTSTSPVSITLPTVTGSANLLSTSVGSGATPTAAGSTTTPTVFGSETTPTSAILGTTPTTAPSSGTTPTTPGSGTTPTTPGSGTTTTTPGSGTTPTTPGSGTTPTAPGSGTAPTGPGSGTTPTTPGSGSTTTTPGSGSTTTTPGSGSTTTTPGSGSTTTTPGSGSTTTTPGSGTTTTTPGSGSTTTTPGSGTTTTTPGSGSTTTTPGSGSTTTTPGSGSTTTTPGSGSTTTTPGSGSTTTTPGSGSTTTTPGSGSTTTTPGPGSTTTTPGSGTTTTTPGSGSTTTTPGSGSTTTTPGSGSTTTTPGSGTTTTTPGSGSTTTTPGSGSTTTTPGSGTTTTTPGSGSTTTTPGSGSTTTTPGSGTTTTTPGSGSTTTTPGAGPGLRNYNNSGLRNNSNNSELRNNSNNSELRNYYNNSRLRNYSNNSGLRHYYNRCGLWNYYNNSGLRIYYNNSGLRHYFNNSELRHYYNNSGLRIYYNNSGLRIYYNNSGLRIYYNNSGLRIYYNNSGLRIYYNNSGLRNYYNNSGPRHYYNNSGLWHYYNRCGLRNYYNNSGLRIYYNNSGLRNYYNNPGLWNYYNNSGLRIYYNNFGLRNYYNNSGLRIYYNNSGLRIYYNNSGLRIYYNNSGLRNYYNNSGLRHYYNNSGLRIYYNNSGLRNYYNNSGSGTTTTTPGSGSTTTTPGSGSTSTTPGPGSTTTTPGSGTTTTTPGSGSTTTTPGSGSTTTTPGSGSTTTTPGSGTTTTTPGSGTTTTTPGSGSTTTTPGSGSTTTTLGSGSTTTTPGSGSTTTTPGSGTTTITPGSGSTTTTPGSGSTTTTPGSGTTTITPGSGSTTTTPGSGSTTTTPGSGTTTTTPGSGTTTTSGSGSTLTAAGSGTTTTSSSVSTPTVLVSGSTTTTPGSGTAPTPVGSVIDMSAFFPCMFIPTDVSPQVQQEVLGSFLASLHVALQGRGISVPQQAIQVVQVGRDTIDFTIQDTTGNLDLSVLQNAIHDILSWDEQFTIGHNLDGQYVEYRAANPEDEFNNTVKFEISLGEMNGNDVNLDDVLESDFTIRDILEQDIINFVTSTLGPSSVATLNLDNIWIQNNHCTFSISVPLDQLHAMEAEAIKLVDNIRNFTIHAGSLQVTEVDFMTTETCDFCPPICEPRDAEACYLHTSCQWCVFDGEPQCGDDCLLQETEYELSAFCPCLPEHPGSQQQLQDSFRDQGLQLLRDRFGGWDSDKTINNITIIGPNITFSIRSSMQQKITPDVISFLSDSSTWNGIAISDGVNQYQLMEPFDYTDMDVQVHFNDVDFTNLVTQHSVAVDRLLPALKTLLTSIGNFLQFSMSREGDSSGAVNLTEEANTIKNAVSRGEFILNLKPGWPIGTSVSFEGNFDSICPKVNPWSPSGPYPPGMCACPTEGSISLVYETGNSGLSTQDKVGLAVGLPIALAALAALLVLLMFYLKKKGSYHPPTARRRRRVVSPVVQSFQTNIYSASMDDNLSHEFGKKGARLNRFRDPDAVYGRLSYSPPPSTASSTLTSEMSLPGTPDIF
ncbi:hypothetical protein Bbelb_107590 [Branchiostoma belcheri]|nr:hypothetical protein Bbelb_107590 [Branchiostoma belcheri]